VSGAVFARVCVPVFAELQKETAVARGKVSLLRKVFSDGAGYSERLSTHLLQCLGCGLVQRAAEWSQSGRVDLGGPCPHGGTQGIVLSEVVDPSKNPEFRLPPANASQDGLSFSGLILKKVPRESGLHLRFSLPYLDRHRLIPLPAKSSFLAGMERESTE